MILPGEHKLRTTCSLAVGRHSFGGERVRGSTPDENTAEVHRWLLERNRRLFAVAYARSTSWATSIWWAGCPWPRSVTTCSTPCFGAVLQEADGSFNTILEMGFRSSIEKEWRWRLSRGEPTANLAAFEHLRPRD